MPGWLFSFDPTKHALLVKLFACVVSFRSSNARRARGGRKDAVKYFYECIKPLVHYCIQIHACIIASQSKLLHCASSVVQQE